MNYGKAQMGGNICYVFMDGKIHKILLNSIPPDDLILERNGKADEIAENVIKWIEFGKVFSYPCAVTGTPFQQKVYQMIQEIPKGKVTTYKIVAEKMGTKSYRAVGQALGANPIPLLIPCHRVIGSDRRLTGFGGGIDLKKKILRAEGVDFEGEKVKKEYILREI
ncbi:MAG: MGMT family protein [Theionarchaea archaeon]|nr:MGMT family protein [Theionarchaea archaeon]